MFERSAVGRISFSRARSLGGRRFDAKLIGATRTALRRLRRWIAVDSLAEVVMTTQGSLRDV